LPLQGEGGGQTAGFFWDFCGSLSN
jgi:hypothetical protein